MKKIITLFFIVLSFLSYSQEKTNYNKDVYPLIKEGKYQESIPLLEQFLNEKPSHVNANYWYAKIMEIEGRRLSDPTMIDKAKTHYLTCSQNVTELDMTMATAGRFPDVTGLESAERLQKFQYFLNEKNKELSSLKEKIIRENEQKKYEEEKNELQRKKQIEEDAKIKVAEFSALTINDFITKTGLTELKKILGSYGESLTEGEGDWNFKYEYNTVDGVATLNGKLSGDFRGQLDNFEGEIISGNGYIIFYFENMDIYATQAIKLYISQNKCIKLRGETLMQSSELFFFETTDIENFEPERFLDITENPYEIKPATRKLIGNRNWPITKFQGYFDSEEVGADIIMKGFGFLPVFKKNGQYYIKEKQIIILEENIKPDQIATLKNTALVDKYFELNCEAFQFETDIFQAQDSIFSLIDYKEVQIFMPETYALKYKESITSEELNTLNALAKKWHESLVNGNYEAYKSTCVSSQYSSLEQFTEAHKEFKKVYGGTTPNQRYKFEKSLDYLVVAGDYLVLRGKNFFELKNSGCDMKKFVVLLDVYTQDGRGDASLIFVKENGIWKVVSMAKESINSEQLKAYQVLSKENLQPCNCIEKVIAGDIFGAEKCAFYFRFKKLENKEQTFEECFQTLNYCDYDKQIRALEISLGYSSSIKYKECKAQ